MHIRKFDHDYSRRAFLSKAGAMVGAGVLAPLWPLIGNAADISKAYPEELLSIDAYTKGKIKTGDMITADNVDIVKDLLPPGTYRQVKEMGRRIRIVPTTVDATKLFPAEYLEATLRNKGKARFDRDGNLFTTDGKPWIGGLPFPDAKTAEEVYVSLVMGSRYNNATFAMRDYDIGPDGKPTYQYEWAWFEENVVARTDPTAPYLEGHDGKLRYTTALFTKPNDVRGTAFLSSWYLDQREFPDLVGYVPAFKRVRKFPTNQRFEPLVPGFTMYLSDAFAAGDPMLTWGNFKIVERRPMLGAASGNWPGDDPAWDIPVHGGPDGKTFFDTNMELVPECIVIEAEPVGYPRAPVGKKRIWMDARNLIFINMHVYDRRGELFKNYEAAWNAYEKGNLRHTTGKHTTWSWSHFHSHDMQNNRMSRSNMAKEISDGITTSFDVDGLYEKYLTRQAIARLGA
ncbi:DUF1329 domain-containing protein [Nitrogeniibacter mangrovi]|uniref:DUF1329 domain-containing protein n=1 Tax=Nitrogeniibacter mangrovi TaxID=2016596 RepID=A0A6C1B6L4_9RHOO|nr:DUF1329 domain-containing protein [Nitrogeniibacter mangrovi]QID18358.1 DUF1329 domain-containing protein [Nitrogeniibacter mangrovi]